MTQCVGSYRKTGVHLSKQYVLVSWEDATMYTIIHVIKMLRKGHGLNKLSGRRDLELVLLSMVMVLQPGPSLLHNQGHVVFPYLHTSCKQVLISADLPTEYSRTKSAGTIVARVPMVFSSASVTSFPCEAKASVHLSYSVDYATCCGAFQPIDSVTSSSCLMCARSVDETMRKELSQGAGSSLCCAKRLLGRGQAGGSLNAGSSSCAMWSILPLHQQPHITRSFLHASEAGAIRTSA